MDAGATLKVLVVLGGVVGVILLCAWGARRLGVAGIQRTGPLRVLAVLPVGARERLLLVEVQGVQLLLGVTAQSIRTLHVFDGVTPLSDPGESDGDFASRLQGMIRRSLASGRKSAHDGDDA